MADSSTEKNRTDEHGVRTVKGRWSEWSMDGNGIECETKEQTSGLSMEDLAWLIEPHREALLPEPSVSPSAIADAERRGREAERAAVVKYLRRQAVQTHKVDFIEDGRHTEPSKQGAADE